MDVCENCIFYHRFVSLDNLFFLLADIEGFSAYCDLDHNFIFNDFSCDYFCSEEF